MKTSFITTVYNEEKSIGKLLDSLTKQSKKPNEIVVVDAGSSDQTVFIARKLLRKSKIPFKIIRKNGNRSVGRNHAIQEASNDIILCSDAGCFLDENWVKAISSPFKKKNTFVVSGYYLPIAKSVFEKCLAAYTSVLPEKLNPKTFLPSTRSIAFKKSLWKSVGGFPEYLDTCEDMIFDKKIQEKGYHFVFKRDAIVYWPQRENLQEACMQFIRYAKGDGLARYFRPQTPFLFFRVGVGIFTVVLYFLTHKIILLDLIILCLSAYIIWSIWKNYKFVKSLHAIYLLPLLQITADFAVIVGMSVGMFESLIYNYETSK